MFFAKFIRIAAFTASFLVSLMAGQARATPIVIGTLANNSTPMLFTGASFQWFDLAVGFTVSSAGYVSHISTSLSIGLSLNGGFVVGLATNELIGNPPIPDYFSPPPGSLWETNACSSLINPYGLVACEQLAIAGPVVALPVGDEFDTNLNVFLPSKGTYWVYTRYLPDDVFNSWRISSSLLASRTGTRISDPTDTTFLQNASGSAHGYEPIGLQVTFEPEGAVPEPISSLIFLTGLLALVVVQRWSTCFWPKRL